MATIRKRGDSYQIRVSSGYDSQYRQVVRTKTWKPTPGMTARQVENELNRQTVMFEQLCQKGVYPSNIKFDEFAEKWMTEYARTNLKNTTYQRMVCTSKRVLQTFGHMRVDKITHGHIQAFLNKGQEYEKWQTACPKKRDTSPELSFRCVQLRFKAGNAGKQSLY